MVIAVSSEVAKLVGPNIECAELLSNSTDIDVVMLDVVGVALVDVEG